MQDAQFDPLALPPWDPASPLPQGPGAPPSPLAAVAPAPALAPAARGVGHRGAFGELPSDLPASHALGLSFLLSGLGTVIGYKQAGVLGSIGGGLAGGAAVNGIHALILSRSKDAEAKAEAVTSGIYAIGGLALAAFFFYKAKEPKESK